MEQKRALTRKIPELDVFTIVYSTPNYFFCLVGETEICALAAGESSLFHRQDHRTEFFAAVARESDYFPRNRTRLWPLKRSSGVAKFA